MEQGELEGNYQKPRGIEMKHKHADLIMKYAEAAQESETPWDIFQFESESGMLHSFSCEPDWEGMFKINLKPQTKVIDFSKVNYDIVPVFTKHGKVPTYIYNYKMQEIDTLVTGKRIAWTGGECPLPEGVMVKYGLDRQTVVPYPEHLASNLNWSHNNALANIIWFEVTGLADGYSWGEE